MPDSSYLYVGLDTHKRSTQSAALIDPHEDRYEERRLSWQPERVTHHLRKLQETTGRPVYACYEAGNIGYGLCRAIRAAGLLCEVVAPSRTPRQASDRKKTDRRDARKLARYLASSDLAPIYVPTEEEEADRALVRTRDWTLKHVQRSKILVDAFLTQHGRLYEKETTNWRGMHLEWILSQKFDQPSLQRAYDHLLETVTLTAQQLRSVEASVEELSTSDRHRRTVLHLTAFLGIETTAAMAISTELPGIERFDVASDLLAYVGMTPSECSSGDRTRRGRITKQGNARVRKMLVQAAWQYTRKPRVSPGLKRRRDRVPPWVAQRATQAQHRLHRKYWAVASRHPRQIAAVAVARELLGFLWSVLHPEGEEMHKKSLHRPSFMGKPRKEPHPVTAP